jgi:ABC-type branched-subunit amino acid transport system substrate-binding protein
MMRTLLLSALLWSTLTADQHHGREIYRRGKLAGVSVGTAAIGGEGVPLPSSSFPCANCHGIWGEGGRESGLQPPPLDWKRLTSPAVSPVTGRRRAAYTPDTLARAITEGADPSGARLYVGMPRYTMPRERMAELLAYLERIGEEDDTDTGVTATTIRIGAALPLSGPLEQAGTSIRETLELVFADASRSGGIYGRTLELVVEDSHGDVEGFRQATHRLGADDHVFAMAASMQIAGTPENGALPDASEAPLIGPVAPSPRQESLPDSPVFYLLPSLYDQARATIDFAVARAAPRRPRVAVVRQGSTFDRDILDGIRTQAALHQVEVVEIISAERDTSAALAERDPPASLAAVLAAHPDYLVFSGDSAGLVRVARELDQASPSTVLVSFIATVQDGVSQLPPRVAAHALFAAPAPPLDARKASLFFPRLRSGNSSPNSYLGLRAAAFAAGEVLVQALRTGGSRPTRAALVRALEGLQHFDTGVTAPLTFGPNQRVGSSGAVMLAVDPTSHSLVAVSGWIMPKM